MLFRPVLLQLLNEGFRPLASSILCGLLLFSQQLAHADIWGYIDDKGVAHFAAERLDTRYELFSRSGQNLQVGRTDAGQAEALRPVSVPTVPPKLIAFFEVSPSYKQVKHLLREAASQYRVDYELLQAVIATESGFDAAAVSPKGAVGLMQIMPATAQRYGVAGDRKMPVEQKLADPRTNIRVGARYLRDLLAMFPGQLELALAAYNAGEGAVLRAGSRVPNYRETQSYVRTVLQLYTVLKPPTPLRVRMELAGGAAGRSNMLASVRSSTTQIPSSTETD
jgi:soluble lytic murein transglycosylase-like protein